MSLMVLGTASHVGKSVTVAAICRALMRRGISVAPFKSQNMSLNSFVTRDGSEIGIAQAMQACAAGIDPVADMNPILLKPKGDMVSQVVLHGRPYKDVQVGEYYQETGTLLQEALGAFERLRKTYGHVVVEGAGGAAELNLYDRDIANIRLARELKLPIILVADIERGGVFAQVYGTIRLLPEDIRSLVAGIIINKFRGDPVLFESGVKKIEEITGVPVLGVIPYAEIPIPSEDSLSIDDKKAYAPGIRIAVLRLPRISNFTDFEVLERHLPLDYVPLGAPLSGYDCIIIPGTKNSVDDLRVLVETGTKDELISARGRRVPIIGICGGYQMLGKVLIDEGGESSGGDGGDHEGIGLLDAVTRFSGYHKTTTQVHRLARDVPPILSAMGEVTGYEIHMGDTVRGSCAEAFEGEGAVSDDGLVFGTYMHGLFQNRSAVSALLAYLYTRKGEEYMTTGCPESSPDLHRQDDAGRYRVSGAYNELARHFEEHVDMDLILSFFSD